MEVLSCSGVQYVGEPNCLENGNQVQVVGGNADELKGHDGNGAASFSDYEVDGHDWFNDAHDIEDNDDIEAENHCDEPWLAYENPLVGSDNMECEPESNSGEANLCLSDPELSDHDEPAAFWVKWRGKWQAGIKCARADWPLTTLRGKPTHDRKKYFVIFFPHTRNYSWADTLLVRPINELPEPIAHRTHRVGLELVKDLTIARRFIMQKLAIGMLNLSDKLHNEALIETARKVMVWKEFAMEASRCKGYSDLGRMLLKLHSMILQSYISSEWIIRSFHSWVKQCLDVQSAEIVEVLKEELVDSIVWNEVNLLWDAPVQPVLGPEWKTWKNEAMKLFSSSHPVTSGGDTEQRSTESPLSPTPQISRKRPKLEIRRADAKESHRALPLEIDSSFFSNTIMGPTEPSRKEAFGEEATPADRWDQIVVEAGNHDNRSRQCAAFVESKGRQCVRWASEGDTYCCVHLVSRPATSAKSEVITTTPSDSPMCAGTTTLGTRCKHRSLYGSSFCKKHRPRSEANETQWLTEEKVIKSYEENISRAGTTSYCKDMVLVGEDENPIHAEPISVANGERNIERCIGLYPQDSNDPCLESPKRHSLYCEKHLPCWLKRARNGKMRIISKEVFVDLLGECRSREQKFHLHLACELFYRLIKSIQSVRNPVPKEVQFQWALSEASRDICVGESLMKLVCREKDKLARIWGFNSDTNTRIPSPVMEELGLMSAEIENDDDITDSTIKCKICFEEFLDNQAIGSHWMEHHMNEADCKFRGYACAVCLDSFTNKKVLENHVQERHHTQFVENCLLLQCIPCGSTFGNHEELWSHVLSVHPTDFKLRKAVTQTKTPAVVVDSPQNPNPKPNPDPNYANQSDFRKLSCRFCGLKFDLLPDLGRHHQAAHMGLNLFGSRPSKRGLRYNALKLKTGRLSRPRFKKGLGAASLKIKKKHIQASNLVSTRVNEATSLGRLNKSQCSSVAKILFSEIQKTVPRPNNNEILLAARSTCCRVGLRALLERTYGVLPESMYLKAAKLCSEQNIEVDWHQQGFKCSKGCESLVGQHELSPLMPLSNDFVGPRSSNSPDPVSEEWEMDECHYVINSHNIKRKVGQRPIVLCDDISFGQESVPVSCVVEGDLFGSIPNIAGGSDGQSSNSSRPWEMCTYVTKPLLDLSLGLDTQSVQLGCACENSNCSPEKCDHVYLFDTDFEDAKDIYGKPMQGRFPYDEKGRIILEEGYPVYECNYMCSCSKTCHNRVLQNGVQVKLQVFKTEKKGWGARATETILSGTFVCEFIGELISEKTVNERLRRDDAYIFDIEAHLSETCSRLVNGCASAVLDATDYGNVSRFINHSCSPNLVSYQVFVERLDCELARVGLYACRDIAMGEELTFDYRYKLLNGEGLPCLCESSNCRGRIH